jgi:hypothetical protein
MDLFFIKTGTGRCFVSIIFISVISLYSKELYAVYYSRIKGKIKNTSILLKNKEPGLRSDVVDKLLIIFTRAASAPPRQAGGY